ncbi:MAG: hypothetical protein P8Z37_17290 [Acidobacteriota bacterium]
MSTNLIKHEREDLFREISTAIFNWSVLERRVFAEAHYEGKSTGTIASSMEVEEREVCLILRKCERQLYSSLRNFRKDVFAKAS